MTERFDTMVMMRCDRCGVEREIFLYPKTPRPSPEEEERVMKNLLDKTIKCSDCGGTMRSFDNTVHCMSGE